jgi:ketosteroid isomerase-like protein
VKPYEYAGEIDRSLKGSNTRDDCLSLSGTEPNGNPHVGLRSFHSLTPRYYICHLRRQELMGIRQELLFDGRRVTTIDFSEGRATHNSWRSVTMNDLTTREPANDPQDLERLLVERENAGDVAGMTALFEPDAVVDIGGGTFLRGKEAIHEFFTKLQVTGFGPEKRKFEFGEQRPALICGDLALTSTRSRNGTVTSEVARRQKDGTWLWVIDRYSVSW